MKKLKKRFEGEVKPLVDKQPFYMVVVEDSHNSPKVKHLVYADAFEEALRLSKKENKKAYVVLAITQVEQIPNVTQFDF